MKELVCCLMGLLLAGLCSALPAGREFATSFMQNPGSKDIRFMVEVAALPSLQSSTKVKVSAMGEVYEREISPGKSVSFKLPDSVEMKGSKESRQAVLIEASQEVTVMSLNFKQYTADTSVIYPVKDWGTDYFIFTPSSTQKDSFKEFSITNYREPNTVEIYLRGSVIFQGKYYRRGSKMTLQLEAFETVQIQSQDNIRGTNVVSRLPVAVSSGHTCAKAFTTCNHVYEQLLPVNSWGKEFIIAPLPYYDIFSYSHNSVFVQASQPTNISVNVHGKVQSHHMFAGQTLELYSQWPHAMYLTSDKGIQVLFEFNGGHDSILEHFDPFLMTILPTSHFSISYSLEGQDDFYNNVIVVARNKDLDGIKIDPKPQHFKFNWRKVDGTDFSWAEMYYSTGANFYQISHHNSSFGVYSFGVAYANGYGSPAAADPADCSTTKCSEDKVCQMRGNFPTCVKKPPAIKAGTCWAMGDPHYRTFDGTYYNFMGSCTYTMVKNCHVDEGHPAFEVDAQNDKRAGSKVTSVSKVIIKVYGYTVTIVRSEFGLVRMNQTLWNLPINVGNGKVKLSQSGLSVIIETDFGLTVQYDWKEYLVITVPGSFSGKVCGLCGNFNSKKEDDLVTPTGSQTSSVVALGKSWRVPNVTDDAQCRDDCSGHCETCDMNADGFFHKWAARSFCSGLTSVMDRQLSECNAVIDRKILHEICLFDLCMGKGMKNFLCNTLQVYTDACQRAGIKIHDWRHIAHCSQPSCPENSHYEFCGMACPATCENPDAATKCNKTCVETCVCDEGFLLSGTECVRKAQCGCMYKDKSLYIEAGASVFTDDLCTKRCTCNETTKEVDCEKPGCRQGYECKVVDDLIGCHPIAYAECSMSAGPHFETFDGHDYNLQGTCMYQLATVCSKDPSLKQFEVSVQYDARGKKVGSGAKLVEVKVYGTSVVVTREHKDSVLINGKHTNLPVNLKRDFTVYHNESFVEIKTEFGLQVTYDWHSTVLVKVPHTYANAMCGLCGNYNHNPKDDLQLKNGTAFRSCQPVGNKTCTISGDPHYNTFNNHTYDFQGTCTYTAAKSCHLEGSRLSNFSVVVENERWTLTDKPNLSVAKLVAVEVYGFTLVLRQNQLKTIMVNDTLLTIPLNLNEGQVEVFQEGFHYTIITDFGLKVTYDMVYKVTVTVPEDYRDKTCGLCGSFDDIKTDEFELPDGTTTKDIQTFGAAWKTNMLGVVCEDGCSGDQCPKCNSALKEIFEEDCRSIINSTGTFAACHSQLNPESYYRDCVFDVCMSQGSRDVLCNSISAYVSDCQTIGVTIDNWRKPDFCPRKCPENSHYQICSETCDSPCPGLTDTISCPDTCAEGCTCNKGYYFSGTDCVALKDCSCYHKGRTYKIGESVISDNCQQRCNCTASGGVECEHFSCSITENCQLNNGILGCHPKQCRMEVGGSITLFSGTTSAISVMGAYEIITHCDESAPDWFRVVAKLQECTATGVKGVAAVYIYFNDLSVTITDRQETWVNGKKVTLPSLPANNIFVRSTETTVIIEYMSHFQLSFSETRELIVTVSDSMADKVCGACDRFLSFRDTTDFLQETMQEYMAAFSAEDFPSCEL